jgi:hypothetical protein
MRAQEIFEADQQPQQYPGADHAVLIARGGQDAYWEIDQQDFEKFRNWYLGQRSSYESNDDKLLARFNPQGKRLFLRMATGEHDYATGDWHDLTPKSWPKDTHAVALFSLDPQGTLIQQISGQNAHALGAFKKFVEKIGAQHSVWYPYHNKNMVVRDGQLIPVNIARDSLLVHTFPDGSKAYKGTWDDADVLWGVDPLWREPSRPQPDHHYRIETPNAGTIQVYQTGNDIVDHKFDARMAREAVPLIQQLAQKSGLRIMKPLPEPEPVKKQMIKPNSNFHKMLGYVKLNPGSTRSDWYVGHLGLAAQGMPGWTSDASPDGRAARAGLIVNKGTGSKYQLYITARGVLVLAMLNAGKKVPIHSLVKS